MGSYRLLDAQEVSYYYTSPQVEYFEDTAGYKKLEKMIGNRIAICCKMPGALNIPVGVYGTNAPGVQIGELGAQCLRDLGISGVEPRVFYDVCRARLNLDKAKS